MTDSTRASGPPRTHRAHRLWKWWRLPPSYWLASGFVAGVLAGLLFGAQATIMQPLADLFTAALQAVGPPVALFTLLSSLVALSAGHLTRLGLRSLSWYLATAATASVMGVLVSYALSLGVGFELTTSPGAASAAHALPGGSETVQVFKSALQGPLPHLIFWAVFLALLASASSRAPSAAGTFRWPRLIDEGTRISYRILNWLMLFAPVGVFALIAVAFAQMRITAAAQLVMVMAAVYTAQAVICLGCWVVFWWSSRARRAFLRDGSDALLTAFATGSSAATVPVEIVTAEQKFGIDRKLVGVILPLGLAIHKIGTAAYLAAVLVFATNSSGQDPGPAGLLWLTLLTLTASILTPPVSGGALAALGFVAGGASLPMSAITVAAAIPLLGKLNTPLNSLGRLLSVVVLAETEPRREREGP